MKSKKRNLFLDYLLIFVIGFILLYPIIWIMHPKLGGCEQN